MKRCPECKSMSIGTRRRQATDNYLLPIVLEQEYCEHCGDVLSEKQVMFKWL